MLCTVRDVYCNWHIKAALFRIKAIFTTHSNQPSQATNIQLHPSIFNSFPSSTFNCAPPMMMAQMKKLNARDLSADDLKTCVEWNELPKLQLYALNQAASNTYDYTSAAPPNTNQNELRTLGIAMETNEDGNLLECQSEEDGSLRFKLKDIDFVVKRAYEEERNGQFLLHIYPVGRKPNAIWEGILQTRLYAAKNNNKFKYVFGDIFEFGIGNAPLELQIEPEMDDLKLEFRYIYQIYRELPTFEDGGDLNVYFPPDQNPLRVNRALLALYTPRLANVMSELPQGYPNPLPFDVSKEQFKEMLWQIYRAKQPADSKDFPALCAAATELGDRLLLHPLCQYIVKDHQLTFDQKMQKAVTMGLKDAVRQLCYDSIKSNQWAYLLGRGFDARTTFGQEIYSKWVLPAIIEAKKDLNSLDSKIRECLYEKKYPRPMPAFENAYEASNRYNVTLKIDGKCLYVNRGVLETNGCMIHSENDVFIPMVSTALKAEMERSQLQLEQVVIALLHLMYGIVDQVQAPLARACLIFAADHGMHKIVPELEMLLFDECVTTPETLLDHLLFAEKYGLKNLERRSLWQLESHEYHNIGLDLIGKPEYDKLGTLMKLNVEDRLCSGWAVFDAKLAKRTPSTVKSLVLKMEKGPTATPQHGEFDLQTNRAYEDGNFDQFSDIANDEDEAATAILA